MDLSSAVWAVGRRVPRRLGDAFARLAAPLVSLKRLPAVDAWADSVEHATGARPTSGQRRRLLANWIRNNLWSLSLAAWSDEEILRVVSIDDDHLARLRESVAGPGLVLALPHMGSWDFAGAWAARVGLKVVSVAERLPNGVYERFAEARAAMGMIIYPVDQPDVMRLLAEDVKAGRLVCLLADRDLSSRGLKVPWPGADALVGVPAGPALLARRTGADLRVTTTYFDGDRLRLEVSEPIEGDSAEELMTGAVEVFADAVRRHPESWLMLRKVFL
ncbi:LpxL/LpxP family acyltransferase [Tessaracoccus sp. Y36]